MRILSYAPLKMGGSRFCKTNYVIVVVQLRGIYGSKLTKSERDSPRTRFVYVAINPSQLYYKYYISLEAKHQRT